MKVWIKLFQKFAGSRGGAPVAARKPRNPRSHPRPSSQVSGVWGRCPNYLSPILLFSILLQLSGCTSGTANGTVFGNYRSLQQLLIIETIGVDKPGCTVSVSSGGKSNESPPVVISQQSHTIPRALEKIQDYASKEHLFFAHTNDIIIGEDAAESGILEVLEFIQRSQQLRLDINLLIVKGGTAQSLITGSAGEGTSITSIIAALERDAELRSEGRIFTCAEISQTMAKNGCGLIFAVEPKKTEGAVFSESPEMTALPAGFGIIKDGKLAGYIDSADARGVSILQNRVNGGTTVLETGGGVLTTAEYIGSRTAYSPVWGDNGELKAIRIETAVEAGISAATGHVDASSEAYLSELEEKLKQRTETEVAAVLGKIKETGADFLALGGIVERKDPIRYNGIPGGWEKAMESVEFDVQVSARIKRSYNLDDSVDYADNAGGDFR